MSGGGSREVLTLQFGTYANYVGAHFWNTQDELFSPAFARGDVVAEVDASVLYREGTTRMGAGTYTPRALVFELKGNLGSLNPVGSVYEAAPTAAELTKAAPDVWGGPAVLVAQEPEERNSFLKYLDSEVGEGGGVDSGGDSDDGELTGGAYERKVDGEDAAAAAAGVGSEEAARMRRRAREARVAPDPSGGGAAASASGAGAGAGAGGGDGDGGGERGRADVAAAAAAAAAASAEPTSFNFGLDDSVALWSDYLKVHFHPRTVHELSHFSTASPFDAFSYGTAAMRDTEERDRLEDSFRYFLEECDHLQAVQCVVDVDSGFAGIASDYLDFVADECPRTPVLTWGALAPTETRTYEASTLPSHAVGTAALGVSADPSASSRVTCRAANLALAWSSLSERSTAFVPVSLEAYARHVDKLLRSAGGSDSAGDRAKARAAVLRDDAWLPHLHVDPLKHYHTAAVLAAAIDTATLPFRLSKEFDERAWARVGDDARARVAGAGDAAAARDARVAHKHRGSDSAAGSGAGAGGGGSSSTDTSGGATPSTASAAAAGAGSNSAVELAMPRRLTAGQFLSLVAPRPSLPVAQVSVAMPFAHPLATPSELEGLLNAPGRPKLHQWTSSHAAYVSWPCDLPAYYRDDADASSGGRQGGGSSSSRSGGAASAYVDPRDPSSMHHLKSNAPLSRRAAPAPFSQTLALRGVVGGAGVSLSSVGRVLDATLRRSAVAMARHSVLVTPVPVAISSPNYFERVFSARGGAFDVRVQAAAGERRGWGLGRGYTRDEVEPSGWTSSEASGTRAGGCRGKLVEASETGDAARGIPLSMPMASVVSNGPAFRPALSFVADGFRGRNRADMHPFTSNGVGDDECRETTERLDTLVDSYAGDDAGDADADDEFDD